MEQIKQYEYVDLGLPSGLKWAKCNVGAKTETDYGYYFQWGDIEDKTNSDCRWKTYKHCNGSYNKLTKYCVDNEYGPFGTVDNKITLGTEDDIAAQIMGGDWRMPTKDDFQELLDNTDSEWIENYNNSGVNGRKLTSKTDISKYIFIPASGDRAGSSFRYQGDRGSFWSSSLLTANPYYAYVLYFYSDRIFASYYDYRCYGFVVRGVML